MLELRLVHHTGVAPDDRTVLGCWMGDSAGVKVTATFGAPPVIDVWWSRTPEGEEEAWYRAVVQPELVERICRLGGIEAAVLFEPSKALLRAMTARDN